MWAITTFLSLFLFIIILILVVYTCIYTIETNKFPVLAAIVTVILVAFFILSLDNMKDNNTSQEKQILYLSTPEEWSTISDTIPMIGYRLRDTVYIGFGRTKADIMHGK